MLSRPDKLLAPSKHIQSLPTKSRCRGVENVMCKRVCVCVCMEKKLVWLVGWLARMYIHVCQKAKRGGDFCYGGFYSYVDYVYLRVITKE